MEKDALSQPICRRRQHTMTPPAVHVAVIPVPRTSACPRHLQPVSGDHRSDHSLPTRSRHEQQLVLICANKTLRSSRVRQLFFGPGTSALTPSRPSSPFVLVILDPVCCQSQSPSSTTFSRQRWRAQSLSKLTSHCLPDFDGFCMYLVVCTSAPLIEYGPLRARAHPPTHHRDHQGRYRA